MSRRTPEPVSGLNTPHPLADALKADSGISAQTKHKADNALGYLAITAQRLEEIVGSDGIASLSQCLKDKDDEQR